MIDIHGAKNEINWSPVNANKKLANIKNIYFINMFFFSVVIFISPFFSDKNSRLSQNIWNVSSCDIVYQYGYSDYFQYFYVKYGLK